MGIILKTREELARMREAGRLVAAVLDAVEAACVPGATTAQLNAIAAELLDRFRARSSFLGYQPGGVAPYPAVLCTSINDVVVHGIPDQGQALQEGDIISIDFACQKNGYSADAARTVAVGVISAPARALLNDTRLALEAAIRECQPGKHLGDLGAAIEALARERGYGIVRDFVGHGIGREMHEAPAIPNYGRRGSGLKLQEGMVLAIEPMLTYGSGAVRVLNDDWTVVTREGGLAAHWEHSVAITKKGPRILTLA
jgi:methionyl aminopeptidase